ncbi:MAG: hypothetical protein JKY61_13080 [Planctomycetes bacterium]|nr:hypothetical protein [Planctomycetota bacterium]
MQKANEPAAPTRSKKEQESLDKAKGCLLLFVILLVVGVLVKDEEPLWAEPVSPSWAPSPNEHRLKLMPDSQRDFLDVLGRAIPNPWPTDSAGWAIAIRIRERAYDNPGCTKWVGIIESREQRDDGVMEFSVRVSRKGHAPKVTLIIGEPVTSFRDKYTGLDPARKRWEHTPLLEVGDAVALSGRIIGLPPASRDYKKGMLTPAFSFWGRSIEKYSEEIKAASTHPERPASEPALTDPQAFILQTGKKLHLAYSAKPGLLPDEDDALVTATAESLYISEAYLVACYEAFLQYKRDGMEEPSEVAMTLIFIAMGLED